MDKSARQQDKDAAKILFLNGIPQKEIANILDRTEATVSDWAKEGKWREERSEKALFKETNEERIWKMIDYQCSVIEHIIDVHKNELEDHLSPADLKKLLIDKGDIDALQKLFTTIKSKEIEWASIVRLIREFTEYIESRDLNLAQAIIPLAHEFINEKR